MGKRNFSKKVNVHKPDDVEFSGVTAQMKPLNHLGFVAAAIDQLGIVESINRLIPPDPQQIVSTGESVAAIILNFLSGSGQERLYITPEFFESIAVERLFGKGITAQNLNDDTLGRALDRIAESGPSLVFNTTMIKGAQKSNLISKFIHLDTTSISVHGEFQNVQSASAGGQIINLQPNQKTSAGLAQQSVATGENKPVWTMEDPENEADTLKITYGYSKDHRPDLKQVVISMMLSGPARLPLFMQTLDGNTSDKTHFADAFELAKKVFQKRLAEDKHFIWVADSALYTSKNLAQMSQQGIRWLTRVPNVIREARALFKKEIQNDEWVLCQDANYQVHETFQEYAGVKQRWFLVFSKQAFQRDSKSFQRAVERERAAIEKTLSSISRQPFSCQADAKKAIKKAFSKFKYHGLQAQFTDILQHSKPGRPAPDSKPKRIGVKVDGIIYLRQDDIDAAVLDHGKFIVATNILDADELSAEQALVEYKKQSSCESAFKFFKNDTFQMNKIFLKRPPRIAAMMMILNLAVAVAHLVEYNLRTALQVNNDSVPDKAKKPTQKLTFALLAFHMVGVGVVTIGLENSPQRQSLMTTVSSLQKKLIKYFGSVAEAIYFGHNWSFSSGFA